MVYTCISVKMEKEGKASTAKDPVTITAAPISTSLTLSVDWLPLSSAVSDKTANKGFFDL